MRKAIFITLAFVFGLFINVSVAQDAKTIQLEQTTGEFTIQSLTLSEGTYVFEISNNGIDHEVGFVVAPKGKTDAANHIKEAYVQKTIKNGETLKLKHRMYFHHGSAEQAKVEEQWQAYAGK